MAFLDQCMQAHVSKGSSDANIAQVLALVLRLWDTTGRLE